MKKYNEKQKLLFILKINDKVSQEHQNSHNIYQQVKNLEESNQSVISFVQKSSKALEKNILQVTQNLNKSQRDKPKLLDGLKESISNNNFELLQNSDKIKELMIENNLNNINKFQELQQKVDITENSMKELKSILRELVKNK